MYGYGTWSLIFREEHGLTELGAEENIWTDGGGSDKRLEKSAR
jgi:hypothetical protein